MTRKLNGILLSLLIFFSIVILCEVLSHAFSSDQTSLQRILNILEQDKDLFWRQRPNLNIIFEGAKVKTNGLGMRAGEIRYPKAKDTLRIIGLGGSPTFGWGVEADEAYAYRLEKLLKAKYQHRNIEVINAGMIGYSSYQGLQFLKKEILNLSPDIITVAYVINDVDKHRFFRSNGKSDKELDAKNQFLVSFENILNRSRFVNLYRNLILKSQSKAVQYFGSNAQGKYLDTRRVTFEDYAQNIKGIVHLARKNDIEVVLVKMPVNLPADSEISIERQKAADQYIEKALLSGEDRKYKKGIAQLNSAIDLNPHSGKAYFYLGRFYEKRGLQSEAQKSYEEVRTKELNECGRLGKKYNKIMDRIADEENVILVDIVSKFNEYRIAYGASLFQDDRRDVIHPNGMGHDLIANAIYDAFIEKSFNGLSWSPNE